MISAYTCLVLGEQRARAARWHISTVRRAQAFAIAIHIPVLLWLASGYLIASSVFALGRNQSLLVAICCAGLIYLIERVVLATPKGRMITVLRIVLGTIIALLGSLTVDLVVFEKEIVVQLQAQAEAKTHSEWEIAMNDASKRMLQKKRDWQQAQQAANCEANGTCGSGIRSIGPVYRELAKQAEFFKAEYIRAQIDFGTLEKQRDEAISAFKRQPIDIQQSGLLSRVVALHEFILSDISGLVTWCLVFALVLVLELVVVLCKLLFGETVDDELDRMREELSRKKAADYLEAMTSPLAQAREALRLSF